MLLLASSIVSFNCSVGITGRWGEARNETTMGSGIPTIRARNNCTVWVVIDSPLARGRAQLVTVLQTSEHSWFVRPPPQRCRFLQVQPCRLLSATATGKYSRWLQWTRFFNIRMVSVHIGGLNALKLINHFLHIVCSPAPIREAPLCWTIVMGAGALVCHSDLLSVLASLLMFTFNARTAALLEVRLSHK